MIKKWLYNLSPLFGLVVFGVALWAFHHALKGHHAGDLRNALRSIPTIKLLAAFGLTGFAYFLLTCYDVLAFHYIRRSLSYGKIVFTSFLGYAVSNNVGYSFLSGGSIRYRLYSSWGLNTSEIAKIIAFGTFTGWLGFSTLGGISCLLEPKALLPETLFPLWGIRAISGVLLLLPVAYVGLSLVWRKPLTIRSWQVSFPRTAIAITQVIMGALDFAVYAGILYMLLPPTGAISFPHFIGLCMIAHVLGIVSQVPGGLGVFETVILLLVTPEIQVDQVLGALLLFRVAYYLTPVVVAAACLGLLEIRQRRVAIGKLAGTIGVVVAPAIPNVFAFCTFLCGAILLFSGAIPPLQGRFAAMRDVLPLLVLELPHFLASLAGVGLLLLARGLQRRVDLAFWLTVALLGAGVALSLLKWFQYEEAMVLGVMLIFLVPCRPVFNRRASLLAPRLSLGWLAAVGIVVGCSIWLGFFAHRHVEYSHDLWWQFSLHGDAPRFLRATAGALVLTLVFAAAALLRPAPPKPAPPNEVDRETVAKIVANARETSANLALLGDKHFLFSEDRAAFIMYAIEERSAVTMGDPIGPEAQKKDLVWTYREWCERRGTWPVYYQIRPDNIPLYLDAGLSLIKLGEEARVDLSAFSLDGSRRKEQRNVIHKLEREGCAFRIIPAEEVSPVLPELKAISDDWLEHKNTREKRFSLGRFDETYLKRFPHALVSVQGKTVAFANVWQGAGTSELSVDLMRRHSGAPPRVMEYLLLNVLLWGKQEGYQTFNLGMAPLSGLENRAAAPLWNRLGSLVFHHGEHFYNFQGLRQYKEKFDPAWEPRYLACPAGFALPRILANVASLIAGGVVGVVAR